MTARSAPRSAARKKSPAGGKRPAAKKTAAAATRAENKRSLRLSSPVAQQLLRHVREICLALPETTEVEAWGHPTFRVAGKIFAGFGADAEGGSLGVKTTPDMQAALVGSDPRFTIAAYVGKHGWVDMALAGKIDWSEVDALVRGSYQLVAPPKLARRLADES